MVRELSMHDIKWIRENPEAFKRGLKRRGLDSEAIFDEVIELDDQRRANITLMQQWQEERNRKSKEIGKAKAAGDEARTAELLAEVSRLKSDITRASEQVSEGSIGDLERRLAEIPNLPLDEVPDGADEPHGGGDGTKQRHQRQRVTHPPIENVAK